MDNPATESSLADGAELRTARPPTVSDYELLRRIGQGAYGEVWLARSVVTGVLRAIKVVWRNRFQDERPYQREFEGIQKFERISREHSSQLALFHIGRNDTQGYFYYVMELADDANAPSTAPDSEIWTPSPETYASHTLRADLAAGRLPAARVLELGLALAEALGHLHRNGLVHRDVKPSNVIFVNGRPKLADIGLVTQASEQRSIVGTEGYLAPEGPGTAGADIYALGKVLYETLTGLDRRLFPELPADMGKWPDAPLAFELNAVLSRACATASRDRYRELTELQADLARLAGGESVRRRLRRQRCLRYSLRVLIWTGVVALGLGNLGLVWQWKNKTEERSWSKNSAANDAFREGEVLFHQGTWESINRAIGLFQRATELDPHFARAYACLAYAYGWTSPSDWELLDKARMAATKAVALDPRLGEAHWPIGAAKALLDRDWNGAEEQLKLALKLSPRSADVLYQYANFLVWANRGAEAIPVLERALKVESQSVLRLQNAAWLLLATRQYERATGIGEMVEKNAATLPQFAEIISQAHLAAGNYRRAIEIAKAVELSSGHAPTLVKAKYEALLTAYDRDGDQGYWRQLLEWSKQDQAHPAQLAALYARLGDRSKALDFLELALARTPFELTFRIAWDPDYDSLRADKRFGAVMQRLGLAARIN